MMKRDENGVYHWNGTVDVPYEQKTFKIVFGVCGGSVCSSFSQPSSLHGSILASCC